ncbi:MAG: acyltransferase, partial [Isosphaeraceae bacterium]|nr:acyltransferase [Isosphaeraceae bacterium]
YWGSVLAYAVLVLALDAAGLGGLTRGMFGLELNSPRRLDTGQWLGNLTLTESWRPRVFGGELVMFTRVSWSLCYQEQFYLVCTLALLLFPKRLYGALAAATVAVVGFRVFAWDAGGLHRLDGMFPLLWHEFAIGLAVYWRLNVARSRLAHRAIELGLLGLLVVACSHALITTAAGAAFGLILIALRDWDDRIERLAWLDPIRALGRRSYSIYLVHLPACVVAANLACGLVPTPFWVRALLVVPLVVASGVAAGVVFHRWIERPFTQPPSFRLHRPKAMLPAMAPAG